MNYYSHHIGDYAQATMHLSLTEDGILSRLTRRYYSEEQPIKDDLTLICRWVGARSQEEREAVPMILAEFFKLRDGFWHNDKIDEEIALYQSKSAKASASAAKRWKSPGNATAQPEECDRNANAMPTHSDRIANPMLTNNQEPITNNQELQDISAAPVELALDLPGNLPADPPKAESKEYPEAFEQAWSAYPTRPGANKRASFKAWTARIRDGTTADQLLEGTRRYATFCAVTGKIGTEFVKQPATFFGPDKHFDHEWNPPKPAPLTNRPGAARHGNFAEQDYHAGISEDGRF